MPKSILRTLLLSAALVVPAGFASAQNLCGGMGGNGIWLGGAEDASDISTSDTHLQQLALILGNQGHVGLFSVSEQTTVRVEAEGMLNGDTVLRLIDATGRVIDENDDWGNSVSSRVEQTLSPGTYCVSTTSFAETGMSASVRVSRAQDHEPLLPDAAAGGGANSAEGCASAPDMGVLSDPITYNASANDAPYLRFTLPEDGPISLTAENSDADPTLALIDPDGREIASNDDADGLNSRIDQQTPLAAGEYCLSVGAIGDASLPILVTAAPFDPLAAMMISVNAGEAAPPLDGTVPIEPLSDVANSVRFDRVTSSDATWYEVSITQPGLWVIDAISVDGSGDPWISLFDDFGRRLASNDDVNGTRDSQIVLQLNPGTYYFALKELSDGETNSFRVRFERWVKAQ